MLNKETFKEQMELLSIAFPKWDVDISSSKAMGLWYLMIQDYDDYELVDGVKAYIKNNKFGPSIAALIEEMKEVDPYKGLKRKRYDED